MRYYRSGTNAYKDSDNFLQPFGVDLTLRVGGLWVYRGNIFMTDETCITIMINNDFVAMPMKEAARVYQRLGDLLNLDEKYPKGDLFNLNKKVRDDD